MFLFACLGLAWIVLILVAPGEYKVAAGFSAPLFYLVWAMWNFVQFEIARRPSEQDRQRARLLDQWRRASKSRRYPDDWDELRLKALERDGYRCANCGRSGVELHAHHIVPLSVGGTNSLSNLKTLCEDCHKLIHPHMR